MEFSYRRWPLFKGIVFLSIVYFCLVAVFLNAVALLLFDVHVIPHFAEFSFAKNMFGGLLGLIVAAIFSQYFFYLAKAFIFKETALTLEGNILTIHRLHNQKLQILKKRINVHDIAFIKVTYGPSIKRDEYLANFYFEEDNNVTKLFRLNSFYFQNGTIRTLRKIKHLTGAKFKIDASPLRHQNCFTRFIDGPNQY